MSEESVYLLWDCVDCGESGIPCSPYHRECPSCGHVRTFVEFDNAYLPGNDETWDEQQHVPIEPEDLQRLMKTGPSWFCTNCQADNYGDEDTCHHCKASRKASDAELREALDYETFQAYQDGDRGVTADLVEQFGEYAGMRAAQGESFAMEDSHEGQLAKAQEGRSAFKEEMEVETHHASRPLWDDADLPSTVESYKRTHGSYGGSEESSGGDRVVMEGPRLYAAEPDPVRPSRSARMSSSFMAGMVLFALVVAGIFLLIWGFQTYEVTGQVDALNWERQVFVDRWQSVTKSDWRHNLTEREERKPVRGSGEQAGVAIQSCAQKHHHYEQYVCGTKEVSCTHMESYTVQESCTRRESYTESYSCSKTESYSCGETCSTSRGSNGIATRSCSPKTCTRTVSDTCTRTAYRTVPDTCTRTKYRPMHTSDTVDKYCDRSIKKSFCSYRTQEWAQVRQKVDRGVKRPARWPTVELGALERSRRADSYEVVLSYKKEGRVEQEDKTVNFTTFQQYHVGDPVIVTMTNFGSVVNIRHVPQEGMQ